MRSAFGGRFIEAGQKPVIAALSGCGIALYLVYHLTRFQVSAVWPLAPRGDASIIFDQAHAIFERAAYPSSAIFPYPPSAVLIFYGLCRRARGLHDGMVLFDGSGTGCVSACKSGAGAQ